MRLRRLFTIVLAMGLIATSTVLGSTGAQGAETGCAEASHPGGDWPAYGQDLDNTRNQEAETTISTTTVPRLAPAWTFSPSDTGAEGALQSTPVIAEGCVYLTTASGWVFALNADNGDIVWSQDIADTVAGVCCGGTLFAPAVHDGIVYLNVSNNPDTDPDQDGPHVVAMDSQTGDLLWRSDNVASEPGAYTNTSSVYYDGMIWIGISNPEQGFHKIGGFALVDAETGEVLKRTLTIPEEQAEAGFAGGGIWTTAAVDAATGYGYAGTAQPSPWPFPEKESEYTNAIVKFDMARARDAQGSPIPSEQITNPNFGEIVGARKGTPDQLPYIDVDFAASPTLYRDRFGRHMVAEFQKSGWLHAAYTRHMTAAWSTPISPYGWALGNYSSTATDGENIFGVGTYPGQLVAVDGTTGQPLWASPVVTTIGGNPVAYANGVVYHADGKGFLDAYDSTTGAPLLHHPMSADVGETCTNAGGGLAIARNTVFSVCGDRGLVLGGGQNDAPSGWVIAYRLS